VVFEVKGRPSISEAKVRAVIYWERLRKGESISLTEAANILKFVKVEKHKKLDMLDSNLTFQYQDLKNQFSDLPDGHWYDVFTLLSPSEISYIRAMLRRGEKITKQPRI